MTTSRSRRSTVAALLGGDEKQAAAGTRSIGGADEAVALIVRKPQLFESLMTCLAGKDPVIAARAANAAEKLSRINMRPFKPYKDLLLSLLDESASNRVRWQLALVIPRLELTPAECRRAAGRLEDLLTGRSSIVRTFALQGLADLLRQHPARLPAVLELLHTASRTGTAAMRARSRILLQQFEPTQPAPGSGFDTTG